MAARVAPRRAARSRGPAGRLILWLLLILVALAGLGAAGARPALRLAGAYLVAEDPLERADLLILLAGEPPLRAPEAARLFAQGYAPRVLVSSERKPANYDALLRRGIRVPRGHETDLLILKASGVPERAITFLDAEATSTFAEARAIAKAIAPRAPKKVILVSSKSHTRRVKMIFRHFLGPGVTVLGHGAPEDAFDPAGWWRSRHQVQAVLLEYVKLANFWLFGDYWERRSGSPKGGDR